MSNKFKYYFSLLLFLNFVFLFTYYDIISVVLNRNGQPIPKLFDSTKFKVFESNKWIFNFNVSQYSSIISVDINNDILIEALFLFDVPKNYFSLKNDLRCLIKIKEQVWLLELDELLGVDGIQIIYYSNFLWRARCKIDRNVHKNTFLDLQIAIIDVSYFDYYSEIFDDGDSLITLQQPNFINTSIGKNNQIANCVHMLTRIDDSRFQNLKNWIQIQQDIGFSKIRFYTYHVDPKYINFLQEMYKNDFIDIIKYPVLFDDICEWHLKQYEKNPESKLAIFLLNNCEKAHELHFKLTDEQIYYSHERMNTNDCLLNYKYLYEYLTNYDIDEIIFPRLLSTNSFDRLFDNRTKCKDIKLIDKSELKKYSIYDFAHSLFTKYSDRKIGSLKFEHVLFIEDHLNLTRDMLNFNRDKDNVFKIENNHNHIYYEINSENEILVEKFKQIIRMVECLNETYMKNGRFKYKWNNLYGTKIDSRDGKSIFNTDHVESINQHFAKQLKPGMKTFNVPISDGFVSHMRDHLTGFYKEQMYPFDYLQFDFEYYVFLLSISN